MYYNINNNHNYNATPTTTMVRYNDNNNTIITIVVLLLPHWSDSSHLDPVVLTTIHQRNTVGEVIGDEDRQTSTASDWCGEGGARVGAIHRTEASRM